ncbi:MAG: hypothetical protein JST48_04685 [Bacteroidetes bacterium]|nr:hypothetical protein [Bacteroidota bacterium]
MRSYSKSIPVLNTHLAFKEEQDKFFRLPDSLIQARRKRYRHADSVYLFSGAKLISRNVKSFYSSDERLLLNLKLSSLLQEIDSAYKKEFYYEGQSKDFKYEGLPADFLKDVHRKIGEQIK